MLWQGLSLQTRPGPITLPGSITELHAHACWFEVLYMKVDKFYPSGYAN